MSSSVIFVLPVSINSSNLYYKNIWRGGKKNQWLLLSYTSVTSPAVALKLMRMVWKEANKLSWAEAGIWLCGSQTSRKEETRADRFCRQWPPGGSGPQGIERRRLYWSRAASPNWALSALSQRQKWRSESVQICRLAENLGKTVSCQLQTLDCWDWILDVSEWITDEIAGSREGSCSHAMGFRFLVGLGGASASFLPNLCSHRYYWLRGFQSHHTADGYPPDITAMPLFV